MSAVALRRGIALAIIALALWSGGTPGGRSAHAAPKRYEIDPVHTRVFFEADHSGFSKAIGAFSAPTGVIWFDEDEPARSSVEAEVRLDTLDLGDEKWNERVARKDFLWTSEHATARFRSSRVEVDEDGTWRVHGELKVRGVTQPVVLLARFNKAARHPLTLRQTVGFSAEATLSRQAFGMTSWKRLVDDAVRLRIEVEAKRKRGSSRNDNEADETLEDGAAPAEPEVQENAP